jgi:hypothetical protein
MLARETATLQAEPVPNNQDVYNSWELHLCTLNCQSIYSFGRTKLGQTVTIGQCTQPFVECNNQCQIDYLHDMKSWFPKHATSPVYTSSLLSICINACGIEAINDARTLAQVYPDPPNLAGDTNFALCNQNLSNCTQKCQLGFNQEIVDFQNKDN